MTENTSNNEVPNYNFYISGKYGKIKDNCLDNKLLSQRVMSDEHFATIRYVGHLPNSTGCWLGVDWDDESRGRHDGTHNGLKYFNTHTNKSGSFVRPGKVSLGLTIEEAIHKRYGCDDDPESKYIQKEFFLESSDSDDECGTNAGPLTSHTMSHGHQKVKVHISGPANSAFNVGSKKMECLKSVVLHSLPVYRCQDLTEGGGQLGTMYPLIDDLDLAHTLISDWWQVATICRQLSALRTLNLSDNKLLPLFPETLFDNGHCCQERSTSYTEAFQRILSLILVRIYYSWDEFLKLFDYTPLLEHLCLAYNKLSVLQPTVHINFVHLNYLDLACNEISNFEMNVLPFGQLKHLYTLLLNDNDLDNISLPGLCTDESDLFPQLKFLAISNNKISSWNAIHHISRIRALRELIFMFNPILEQQKNAETARQDVIAKLPRIKILNRNEIKYDERKGAEIDYLKRYGKKWLEAKSGDGDSDAVKEEKILALDQFARDHPRFMGLVELYGAPEQSEMKEVSRKLKEKLIEITIEYRSQEKGDVERSLKKKIPSHMTVQHLRVLLRNLLKIGAKLEFSLGYVSSSRPLLEIPLEADTREIGFYNVQSGDRVVIRIIGG